MSKSGDVAPRSAWFATAMFTAVYTLHSLDRFVISVVLEPLRHEFHLSDSQLGALSGMAHSIAFCIFALPVGWLLDRRNRVRVLGAMLAIWSAITMLGAWANSYVHLFAMRMGVGAAESATAPAILSLIASLFPGKGRASAMGVVFSGVAIGTGLVFALGGWIAEHWGWKYVFLMAGFPGLILSLLLVILIKEPPRRTAADGIIEKPVPISEAFKFAMKTPTVLFSIIGLTLASMSVASAWTWITPILIREHGFTLTEAGFLVGIAAGFMKFASTFLSGFLGDWIAKGRVERLWIVPGIALIVSFVAAVCLEFAPTRWLVIAFVMLLGFTLGSHYAAPRAVIVSVTPEHMRGSVGSVEAVTSTLFGAGLGPLVTGIISDTVGGEESVGIALLATLSFNLIAALCFWLASLKAREAAALVTN